MSFEAWVLMGAVAAICATALLYTLAALFGHERDVHDLKVKVTTLRTAYHKRLAGMHEIVEVVSEEEFLQQQADSAETAKSEKQVA